MLLGSHLYGNIFTQMIGALLSEKFGGKWVFGAGGFLCSISTLLIPLAARTQIGCAVAARVFFGMGQV